MTQDRNDGWTDDTDRDANLDALLAQLRIEQAPERLTRRLYRIPLEEGAGRKARHSVWRDWFRARPRWVLAPAFAAVPLLVVMLLLQPWQPSKAEVEQARHDVAVAFAYLDRAGLRAGREIEDVLGGELRHSVKQPLSEHMPFTESIHKEETS
ncbi:MAG: hypothetical protein P8Y54_07925 [Xanthomonadales bacterium]